MTWALAFPGREYRNLQAKLLESSPREAGAILLCNPAGERRLAVETVLVAEPNDCVVQTDDRLHFEPGYVARATKIARENDQSIILVHTHPFSNHPRFSGADDSGEALLIPALQSRAPAGTHGALVLGVNGFQGRIYDTKAPSQLDRVIEVGPNICVHEIDKADEEITATHDRNVRAFGEVGQRRLHQLSVAIVGAGGTGSIVAEQLAHLGVRRIAIVDDDTVEHTNLNRLVGAVPTDVGRFKADVLSDNVAKITDGQCEATAVCGNVLDRNAGTILLKSDAIFCCTDTHASRALINQIAYQYLIPAFDMGVRIDANNGRVTAMAGRVQMLSPTIACLQCQQLLDPEAVRRELLTDEARQADPYIVGEPIPQPAVISLNGVVASLAVTTLLAAFAEFPVAHRRLNYRIAEGIVRPVSLTPNPQCIVCSTNQGGLAKGDRWPLFWRHQ